MRKFVFTLAGLLKYRVHQRDLCRQLLAEVLADDAALEQQQHETDRARDEQLREMQGLLQSGRVDIDRSAARRYHAGQLTIDLRLLEQRRRLVAQQIARCRQALVMADQRVKALEKLREQQLAEFLQERERAESREREENWLAVHGVERRLS